jgi:putative colanic acid biosynthesis UDP-glucose lipid carrier transferase
VAGDARALIKPWGGVLLVLAALVFATDKAAMFDRGVLLWWAVAGYIAQVIFHGILRIALRALRARGFNSRRAILVGSGAPVAEFVRRLRSAPWLGIDALGYVSAPEAASTSELARVANGAPISDMPRRLGGFDQIESVVRDHKIDLVYITLPNGSVGVEQVVRGLINLNIDFHWVPDLSVFQLINHSVTEIDGQPVLCLSESPMSGTRWFVKWAEDKVLAALFLVAAALPMAAIAFWIKATSPGPVLFRQERHGLNGEAFVIWKFRTMVVHKEMEGQLTQAKANDPRVTRIGAFLRRTSLDELPQLFNVLQGRMSLVGPRPHAVEHNDYYKERIDAYMLRHRILPGITGWAQVHGLRGPTNDPLAMERRVKYDLFYINNWSVALDIKIILMTIRSVVIGNNAV